MKKPLQVRATGYGGQFWIEGDTGAKDFDAAHVCFSGFYGDINPNVFAAAPELYAAAKALAAVGIINPTGSKAVEAASQALFQAIRRAEQDAPTILQPVEAPEAAE